MGEREQSPVGAFSFGKLRDGIISLIRLSLMAYQTETSLTRAWALRKDHTEAERRLWEELRSRRLNGFKFVRQLAIGPYFADFACRERRVVVEVDGVGNVDVLTARNAVCDAILLALEKLNKRALIRGFGHPAIQTPSRNFWPWPKVGNYWRTNWARKMRTARSRHFDITKPRPTGLGLLMFICDGCAI